jgi:hypothetical protein
MAEVVLRRDYDADREREWRVIQEQQRLNEARHEASMAKLDATLEKVMAAINRVDERVDNLEKRINALEVKMDVKFQDLDRRLSRVESHFTWLFRIGFGAIVLPTLWQIVVRYIL